MPVWWQESSRIIWVPDKNTGLGSFPGVLQELNYRFVCSHVYCNGWNIFCLLTQAICTGSPRLLLTQIFTLLSSHPLPLQPRVPHWVVSWLVQEILSGSASLGWAASPLSSLSQVGQDSEPRPFQFFLFLWYPFKLDSRIGVAESFYL